MSKRLPVFLAVILLLTVASAFAAPAPTASEEKIKAANPNDPGEVSRDEYVADRAIVRDEKTGKLRKPTQKETSDLVTTLKKLTNRSTDGLEATTLANGMTQVDLEGRFAMTVIARPTEDGGSETLCVSTFEEAANFLGLRVEGAPKPDVKPAAEVQ